MKQDEWKRMLESWQKSRKFKQLNQKLRMKNMYNLSKKQLKEIIQGAKEYAALSDDDKEAYDFIDELMSMTPNSIISSLSKTLLQYFYHKNTYLILEDYEMCAEIRDVAKLEVDEARRMLNAYFPEYQIELTNIIQLAQSEVDAHYEQWLELINEQEEE
jgi:hypothetical protein